MDYELLFPSRYLKAADLQGKEVRLTIASVELAELPVRGTSQKKTRGVVSFERTDKGLVLNRTNAETIAKMLGRETDAWAGQHITLYPTEDRFGPAMVPCIRVRNGAKK